MDIYKKRIKKYKKRVKMALLVLYSVKKVNEGIGVWLHFGYSLNEEAATSFLSRVILRPYRFDFGLRHQVEVPQTLIIIGFEALFVLHKKLYKVVQAVFTGLRPVFGPFLLSLVRQYVVRCSAGSSQDSNVPRVAGCQLLLHQHQKASRRW